MNKTPDPKKLTPKQTEFCDAIVDGANQTEAYKHAYEAGNMLPATIANNAYKLMQNNDVATRIRELRDQITAGKAWSFQHGMEEVETNITKARELNQMSAAIRGTEQALKLSGLLVERPAEATVQITKVTVVLSGPAAERAAAVDREIVDSTSRVLDPSEEE